MSHALTPRFRPALTTPNQQAPAIRRFKSVQASECSGRQGIKVEKESAYVLLAVVMPSKVEQAHVDR
jgi:hypothetical protein